MKKMLCMMVILGLGLGSQYSQEQKKPKDDVLKDLVIVDKTEPVPEGLKIGFDSIQKEDAAGLLKFLSSDLLEGRDTATRGYKIASEFAAALFEKWGIKPAGDVKSPRAGRGFFRGPQKPVKGKKTYFQHVALKEFEAGESNLSVEMKEGKQTRSYSYFGGTDFFAYCNENLTIEAPVVFVGYGLDEKKLKFNEYKGIDVKGKFVMMFGGLPQADNKKSPFRDGQLKEKYYPSRYSRDGFSKFKLARDKGALGVIVINESNLGMVKDDTVFDEQPIIPGKSRRISLDQNASGGRRGFGLMITVSRVIAQKIASLAKKDLSDLKTGIDKDLKPRSFQVNGLLVKFKNKIKYKLVKCRNVLGYIEGSDSKLKDEVVVIGAHLDHLGRRGDYIYNGADDNGSGSVGVLEIAEAFALNKIKPKRSVLFALWTGEEKGLLGSRYYVDHPAFPMKKTVCCLNLDMISRFHTEERLKGLAKMMNIKNIDEIIKKIDVKKLLTPSITKSAENLQEAFKLNNKYVGLHLFIRKLTGSGGGSDHASFARKNIPVTAIMAGFREDYHKPTDSFTKVSTTLIRDISRLIYLTAFSMANN